MKECLLSRALNDRIGPEGLSDTEIRYLEVIIDHYWRYLDRALTAGQLVVLEPLMKIPEGIREGDLEWQDDVKGSSIRLDTYRHFPYVDPSVPLSGLTTWALLQLDMVEIPVLVVFADSFESFRDDVQLDIPSSILKRYKKAWGSFIGMFLVHENQWYLVFNTVFLDAIDIEEDWPKLNAIVAHESFHVTRSILVTRDTKLSDSTEEVYAMALSEYTARIMRLINQHRHYKSIIAGKEN